VALTLLIASDVTPLRPNVTDVARATPAQPDDTTTTDTVVEELPPLPPGTVLEEKKSTTGAVSRTPILKEVIREAERRQLKELRREISWWRPRATKQCRAIDRTLHWARVSPRLAKAKQQKWAAVKATRHCGTVAQRREAQYWARLASQGRHQIRGLSARTGFVFGEADYERARESVTYWKQKFLANVRSMRLDAPRAALYAEWFWGLGDGKNPGPLWRCAQGYRPGDGTGEGGLGRPLWNGGTVDFYPYDGGGSGSGAYGWMQMFYSTYLRMARAFLEVSGLKKILPAPERNWNNAFYQFMGSGWGFSHGRRGEWMAEACRS
jgi:hypothetical protein